MNEEHVDDRTLQVLRGVIEEYIASGDPVGSRTLSKSPRFPLSPATIRNIMADLEEAGHLMQPHTSSGRVPTEKAYRWYVDHLRKHPKLPKAEEQLIAESMSKAATELEAVLDAASRLLAQLTHYAGVIVTPRLDSAALAHLEFVPLGDTRIMVIIATNAGSVQHKVIRLKTRYKPEELRRFSKFVMDSFRGKSLRQIRQELRQLCKEERDCQVLQAIELAKTSLAEPGPGQTLRIEGALNILEVREFDTIPKARALLRAFQEQEQLLTILDEVIDGSGLCVIIGSEANVEDLADISLVSNSYKAGKSSGALGVVGPTRMDYDRSMTVVNRISEILTAKLTSSDEEKKEADA